MEEVLYDICYIMETVFETYVIARLMGMFMDYRPGWKKYLAGIYFMRIVLCLVQYSFFPYIFLNMVTGIVTLFAITLLYDASIVKKLTVMGIIVMCEMVAELIAVAILIVGDKDFRLDTKGYNGNAYTFVVISISLWIISEILHRFRNINKESPVPNLFSGSIIAISIIMLILQSIIFIKSSMIELMQLLLVVCMFMVLFLMVYLYDSISRNYMERLQAEIIERERGYYYKQAELLQQNSKELSDFRHDCMNHLYAIHSMLGDPDTEVKRYIEKITGKVQDVMEYSSTGNIVVDSIINYKLSEAGKKGIEVSSQIFLPSQVDIEMENMVVILGNLLDNAIEAAEKVEKGRYINIDIRYKVGTLFIDVKNSYDGMLCIQNGEIATRKGDTKFHGIGLKSVRTTVERCHGTMEVGYTEREFTVKIMLYI